MPGPESRLIGEGVIHQFNSIEKIVTAPARRPVRVRRAPTTKPRERAPIKSSDRKSTYEPTDNGPRKDRQHTELSRAITSIRGLGPLHVEFVLEPSSRRLRLADCAEHAAVT